MSRKRVLGTLAAGGAVAGVALMQVGGAFAGHTNTVLSAALDGRQEVATGASDRRVVGDPNGRGRAYVFGIDGDPRTLCYVLEVDRIAPATAAHIHEAAAGANGPAVVHLARPADGDAADCLTEGENQPNGAPVFTGGATVREILADPQAYYVNVHNADHPGGAIRGQLHDDD